MMVLEGFLGYGCYPPGLTNWPSWEDLAVQFHIIEI